MMMVRDVSNFAFTRCVSLGAQANRVIAIVIITIIVIRVRFVSHSYCHKNMKNWYWAECDTFSSHHFFGCCQSYSCAFVMMWLNNNKPFRILPKKQKKTHTYFHSNGIKLFTYVNGVVVRFYLCVISRGRSSVLLLLLPSPLPPLSLENYFRH